MQLAAQEIGLHGGAGHEQIDPVRDPEQPQCRSAARPRDIVEVDDDLGTIPPGTAERRDGDAHVFPRAVDKVIPIEPTRELAGHRPVPGPARDLGADLVERPDRIPSRHVDFRTQPLGQRPKNVPWALRRPGVSVEGRKIPQFP